MRDRDGNDLNHDGTRKRDNVFLQLRDRANGAAFDRRMEADRLEREGQNKHWEEFRKSFRK